MTENLETEPAPVSMEIKRKVAFITVNTKMNTFNFPTVNKFVEILQAAEKNPKVRVVVIKTAGTKIFSAGFDLSIFKEGINETVINNLLQQGGAISRLIFFMTKPVITQIQASAIGMGCILALSSDFRFVARKSELFFHLPEIDIGIFPATGPTAMAVHVLGAAHAKDMLLTGRKIYLEEFDRWGGITRVCDLDTLDEDVKEFAKNLAKKPRNLLQTIKPSVNMMAYRHALECYSLEDDMTRYNLAKITGETDIPLEDFVREQWKKYGKGSF